MMMLSETKQEARKRIDEVLNQIVFHKGEVNRLTRELETLTNALPLIND